MAQLAAWVTAPHLKKPIDPRKLVEPEGKKIKTTAEKSQKIINGLMDQLGVV